VNAYMALLLLGHDPAAPHIRSARQAIDDLLVDRGDMTYCQPCVSPVWDTGLAAHALLEESRRENRPEVQKALDWLVDRQILNQPGDWKEKAPGANGGGWAFQYNNPWYPDLDDTALVAWAIHEAGFRPEYAERVDLAADWLCSLQSRRGGFASFDPDNTAYFLNEIPFADHGALLDPPTADVTARCIALLRRLGRPKDRKAIERATFWLLEQQEENGSWFGRWGTNYIYGTWSALTALEGCTERESCEAIERAADWLESVQHEDGGWGESNDTYEDPHRGCANDRSTAFQTAWALLGLLAAGRVGSRSVQRGVQWLLEHQEADGLWSDPEFTAPGFPRVFYLKYHGYSRYFPLWALARYRNLSLGTDPSGKVTV
ncbi:MAG TPA: squalene--hopene cyclase, partial [Acidobacteria bacterium]|nr:squalene--hopene cyclase [Acidobacteriota bacterium]